MILVGNLFVGKIFVDVMVKNIDLLSLFGYKIFFCKYLLSEVNFY